MQCPLPRYWMCHAVIALAIAVAIWPLLGLVAGLAAGAAFYAGREHAQWQQGGGPGLPFDWLGLMVPVGTCMAAIALILVITRDV